MLVMPLWALDLVGWGYEGPRFFPAQAGVFLLLLGCGYFIGIWLRPFAWFLVGSKATAVVFLLSESLYNDIPARLLLSAALLDGLMGAGVAGVLWLSLRAESPSPATAATEGAVTDPG